MLTGCRIDLALSSDTRNREALEKRRDELFELNGKDWALPANLGDEPITSGTIERPSGRSSCRTCGKRIAKNDPLLYKEEEPSSNFDGSYRRFYHLACAKDSRFLGLSRALQVTEHEFPGKKLLWCQALLKRGNESAKLKEISWFLSDDDGWAHFIGVLSTKKYVLLTDVNHKWGVWVTPTKNMAFKLLPERLKVLADKEIAGQVLTKKEINGVLSSRRRNRQTLLKAERKSRGNKRRAATLEAKKKALGMESIAKGSKVRIKGKRSSGEVFWVGFSKRSDKKWVGFKANGRTVWADVADVERVG